MAKVNLRDFYPLRKDCIIEVSDEVAEALQEAKRLERNYIERVRWHKAYYSLDAHDGAIERYAPFLPMSPEEIFECKAEIEQLYKALDALPDKQGRRVYAYYVLGFSQKEIARAEGVSENAISITIRRGLKNMGLFFRRCIILGPFFW